MEHLKKIEKFFCKLTPGLNCVTGVSQMHETIEEESVDAPEQLEEALHAAEEEAAPKSEAEATPLEVLHYVDSTSLGGCSKVIRHTFDEKLAVHSYKYIIFKSSRSSFFCQMIKTAFYSQHNAFTQASSSMQPVNRFSFFG